MVFGFIVGIVIAYLLTFVHMDQTIISGVLTAYLLTYITVDHIIIEGVKECF